MSVIAWMSFESPGFLALLALIPLLIALSFRSLAGLGPWRRAIALCARCLVVLLMTFALAGAIRTETVDDLSVIFLLDRSRSIPENLQREAFRYVTRVGDARSGSDRLGVIGFDGVADVEQRAMRTLEIDGLTPPSDADQTNLASAVRLGLAMLPSDSAGRIVVVSDGNENAGDVLREAEQYRAAGIPIDVLPIQYEHGDEVLFEQFKAPPTAAADETVNLQMVLRSQRPVRGKILLWHNETLVDLDPQNPQDSGHAVELNAGPNRLQIPVPLRVAGAHRWEARFVPEDERADTIDGNNVGRAFTVVSGQGRILILTTADDLRSDRPSALILQRALEREKLVCDVEVPGEQPLDQVRLVEYSLVILNNVPAGEFREEEKQTLAVYVRDLGGGLAMIGGDGSFGAGGWMGSPVEEVMPVSFDVKHKKEFLKGALVLVMHACEVPDGNYLGERAAIDAVKTLSSRDLVGVLAWKWLGSEQKNWVVPLQEVGSRRAIIAALRRMSMGDLPDLDEVMRPGVEALAARKDVGPKHMIVISDFDPAPPRQDLIRTMQSAGITCSTIAIGYGGHYIDEGLAKWIANSTGGKFYRTHDHSDIPQIFVRESRIVRRSLVQEIEFTPSLVNPLSPLAAGLDRRGLPPLLGFVLTTGKGTATIPIVRTSEEGDDPVLAHWQAGLGKTVAFTSGLWPQWGPAWTAWPRFSTFWAQTARWASRQAESAAFDVTTSVQGGKAKIRIDALDKNADAIDFMDVKGQVVTPGNDAAPLRLTQTGPGRYEAEFPARDRGNYIVRLRYAMGEGAEASSGALQTGVSVAYSPEFSRLEANLALLDELREVTGGRMLGVDDPAAPFERAGLPRAETRHVMWETLVRWLLVLFLVDVAVRRIAISPIEMVRKARQRLAEMAGRARPAVQTDAVLTSLKGTRERVREERQAKPNKGAAAGPDPAARYERRTPDDKATEDLGRALGGATQADAPVVARPSGKKPAQSEADYTSRLLRAKRRAREDMKPEDEGD
jgi:uncharacterized membrane protein